MNKIDTKSLHGNQCCCTVCRGLATYERPLFAAGQTLTAADLTSLQSYVAGKNRLHNRFLHGWGVVCGLEVICDDCEGSVTITPGYAIDPCGSDIVVGQPVRFDVLAAIRDCTMHGRPKTGDCDPWLPPPDPGCRDAIAYWCVALRYREVETAVSQRLTTGGSACPTLGRSAQPTSGGCGCGGGGGCGGGSGCNCGTGGAMSSAPTATTAVTANNSCAPRRVMECFDISLIRSEEPCAPTFDRFTRRPGGQDGLLGLLDTLIPKRTLLRNIIDCLLGRYLAIRGRLSERDIEVLSQLVQGDSNTTDLSNSTDSTDSAVPLDDIHAAVCHLRAAIVATLAADTRPTRCQLLRTASEISLAAPNEDDEEDQAEYLVRARAALMDLAAVAIQMILDCICRAFLPQCEEDPCDERVELACITVKSGKIIQICNQSCRRYAGAFPSLYYWMSAVPLIPLFSKLLAMICCQPDLLRRNSPLVNDLVPALRAIDPTGRLGRKVVENDFELPRRLLGIAAKVSNTPVLPALAARLERGRAKKGQDKTAEQAKSGAGQGDGTEALATRAELANEAAALRKEIAELRKSLAGGGGGGKGLRGGGTKTGKGG
ncbi:MAG TPA: hypothetical protein VF605_09445 [Allosphingosinicella sp.]|jgi:hypothetical protein